MPPCHPAVWVPFASAYWRNRSRLLAQSIARFVHNYGLTDGPYQVSGGDAVGMARHAAGGSLHGGNALGGDRDFHNPGVPNKAEGGKVLRRPNVVL